MKKFFIDKNCNSNQEHSLPYYAAGIIEEDYRKDGHKTDSGKDFAVIYIDPWGEVQREWRSIDEIEMIEASFEDYIYLNLCIGNIKR